MNEPSALISASALHLLLAQNPELDDLPVVWQIDMDRVIRPSIAVDHPQGEHATQLIADALELPLDTSLYSDGTDPKAALRVQGRWGGADWYMVTYVKVEYTVRQIPAGTVPVTAETADLL